MDFLINRTSVAEAYEASANPESKAYKSIGSLGTFLAGIVTQCGMAEDHYITMLNPDIMFDDLFIKVIGNSTTFLLKCLTGESGKGQHMCLEDELVFAYISSDNFPDAYKGVEKDYLFDFGNLLLENGFKEITDELMYVPEMIDFDISNSRCFIYTVNSFGREFALVFDQVMQYNASIKKATEQYAEEQKDMDPTSFDEEPNVTYKYYVSYMYSKEKEKGNTVGYMMVQLADGPINSEEAINALTQYIENSLQNVIKGSVIIIAFSYMGIQRYEEPEAIDENDPDYYFDEEDEDPSEINEEDQTMFTYEIRYKSSDDDFKDIHSVNIPSFIDLKDVDSDQLAEIVSSYENFAPSVDVHIIECTLLTTEKSEISKYVEPEVKEKDTD